MTSTLALLLSGWIERKRGAAPINGPSQWIWGQQAAHRKRTTLRHTLLGFFIHHAMSIFWALVHEAVFSRRKRATAKSLAQGLTTAALANVVDYKLMPRRLQPGFDQHLSRTSLLAVYVAFGVGLALIRLLRQPNRRGD